MAEHSLIWSAVLEHGAHEEEGIEPEPDLFAHLDDPFRREVLFPLFLVVKIAGGGERHDASVEPDVADLADAVHAFAAGGTLDGDLVDPGSVQLGQSVDLRGIDRQFAQLGLAADDVDVTAFFADVERERHAVIALSGNVPVAHVVEPVDHALAV